MTMGWWSAIERFPNFQHFLIPILGRRSGTSADTLEEVEVGSSANNRRGIPIEHNYYPTSSPAKLFKFNNATDSHKLFTLGLGQPPCSVKQSWNPLMWPEVALQWEIFHTFQVLRIVRSSILPDQSIRRM